MNNEGRLQTIETTLAHQDQQIQDLNDVILEQGREIARLKVELGRAKDKIEEIETGAGSEDDTGLSPSEIAARDKPPHY